MLLLLLLVIDTKLQRKLIEFGPAQDLSQATAHCVHGEVELG